MSLQLNFTTNPSLGLICTGIQQTLILLLLLTGKLAGMRTPRAGSHSQEFSQLIRRTAQARAALHFSSHLIWIKLLSNQLKLAAREALWDYHDTMVLHQPSALSHFS